MPIVVAVSYVICRSFGSRRKKEAITIVIAGKSLPVGTSLQTNTRCLILKGNPSQAVFFRSILHVRCLDLRGVT